jgi:hypothetical protein
MKQKVEKILSSRATVCFLKKHFAPWNDLVEIVLPDTTHFVGSSDKENFIFAPFILR